MEINVSNSNKILKPDFAKCGGLIPAVAQDAVSGKVLMLAYMNEEAWEKTIETGEAHYYSRSRNTLWHKGGTSGHTQKVHEIFIDCDQDAVLLKIEQIGKAACHNGYESCFYRKLKSDGSTEIICEQVFNPEEVYKK